jgi:FKBP-type peptidyl-prolyl cis-trans isomerase 2
MTAAKDGDNVKVHYTGKLTDGSVFDTSLEREPMEFTLGQGQLIPGFENAVIGMVVGDKTTVEISPEQGYGPHISEMVETVPRGDFPPDIEPEVGQMLRVTQPDGENLVVTITGVTDDTVTVDANHPLAGKDIVFDIELIAIN